MQIAGVEGEQVFFMLEDHHINGTLIMDMVNSVLLSGEVCTFFKYAILFYSVIVISFSF